MSRWQTAVLLVPRMWRRARMTST